MDSHDAIPNGEEDERSVLHQTSNILFLGSGIVDVDKVDEKNGDGSCKS